jgi:hypothetical protein
MDNAGIVVSIKPEKPGFNVSGTKKYCVKQDLARLHLNKYNRI